MSERYKVVEGSASGHCCFGATVVDTQTPHPMFDGDYDWVCECFDMESAQKIADALNAAPQPAPDVAKLMEALCSILGWRELRSDNDFPVERIEEIARAALAAHRKGENHDSVY